MARAGAVSRTDAVGELRQAFHEVQASLRRLRGREALSGQLSYPQWRVLSALASEPELTASQLAVAAEVTPATITQMLDALAAAGIVERARSERDRRAVLCRLTPRGRELWERKHEEFRAKWEHALADLTLEELEHGTKLLRRLRELFDSF